MPTDPEQQEEREAAVAGKSLLQVLSDFSNPTQVESLAILLRFSLDSEGESSEEWCRQVLACFL